MKVAEVRMCEVWGCPRRVVSYNEERVGDASIVRSVDIPPKKVLSIHTDQFRLHTS